VLLQPSARAQPHGIDGGLGGRVRQLVEQRGEPVGVVGHDAVDAEVDEPAFLRASAARISIFMNVFNVHVNGYRSFSFAGNGDGVDFFCSSDITIENCFLRNSDDAIALYSHRWNWYGDSDNITIRNCVLLADIAHPINMGTHGNPDKPETTSNVHISNIDILDHNENQLWYQGCIAINAADENTFRNIHVSDVRVERITRGQLVNIRVMKNNMWTTAPGKSIENVTFKNLSLNLANSKIVNPSQILGYDKERRIENVTFENLTIDGKVVHEGMDKPRWYMVSDLIPLFANEHVSGLKFFK
jgi:hypothetical protein